MSYLIKEPLGVGDYLDRIEAKLVPVEGLSTAERMEELLVQLAKEAASEATPGTAERYACAVMFLNTGLSSIRRLRGE